jgi:hypothetical protein
MSAFIHFMRRLFGGAAPLPEDHLTGAVDLSDVPYCMGLLSRNDE